MSTHPTVASIPAGVRFSASAAAVRYAEQQAKRVRSAEYWSRFFEAHHEATVYVAARGGSDEAIARLLTGRKLGSARASGRFPNGGAS